MDKSKISNSAQISARLKKLERYVATHRGDVKARTLSTAFAPTIAGVVASLSTVGQGDTVDTRTGDKINAHSIQVGTLFKMTATCSVRVVVFYDRFNTGSVPATTDILESADVVAPLNYLNTVVQKRYGVLEDYTLHFSSAGVLSATRHKIVKYEKAIHYSGSGSAAADGLSNMVFICVVSDTATAGQINIYSRLLFTDE
jgi:hypothetical protein